MMKSHILGYEKLRKTQKSKHLENKTLFFLQVIRFSLHTVRPKLCQKIDL